jgi:hypothetical protein
MSDPQRKQIRISLPKDLAAALDERKTAAEKAAGVKFSDAQFVLALLEAEIARRRGS